MPENATIYQIAQVVGASKSTVSLALRNDPRVSSDLKMRIQEEARRQGYTGNPLLARLMNELRASRKQRYVANLAFVNISSAYPKFFERISVAKSMREGFIARASEKGYNVDYFWLHEKGVSANGLMRTLKARGIQGAVFGGLPVEGDLAGCDTIWNSLPCVCLFKLRQMMLPFVINDLYYSVFAGLLNLQSLGYSRIGLVLDEWLDAMYEYRFMAGFLAYHQLHHAKPNFLHLKTSFGIGPIPMDRHRRIFEKWAVAKDLDACLCIRSEIVEWAAAVKSPGNRRMGIALLDLPDELQGVCAGMHGSSTSIGRAAADLLINCVNNHEIGISDPIKGIMIEGKWLPGRSAPSIRKKAAATAGQVSPTTYPPQKAIQPRLWKRRTVTGVHSGIS